MVWNVPKWSKVVQNGPKWFEMYQHGPKESKVAQNGPKMSQITQISKYAKCPDCSKCSNTGHCALANFHLFKSVRYLYCLKCQLFQMIQKYNSIMIHWTRCYLHLWWLYFQIQGGIFCIYTCVCISIFFTFYVEVSSQMRTPCMMGTRMICNVFEEKTHSHNITITIPKK